MMALRLWWYDEMFSLAQKHHLDRRRDFRRAVCLCFYRMKSKAVFTFYPVAK